MYMLYVLGFHCKTVIYHYCIYRDFFHRIFFYHKSRVKPGGEFTAVNGKKYGKFAAVNTTSPANTYV